jgi:hypothetical protein
MFWQEVWDGELVVRFEPPLHTRSLAGIFSEYARGKEPPTEEQIDDIVSEASNEHWAEKEAGGDFGPMTLPARIRIVDTNLLVRSLLSTITGRRWR